MATGSRSITCRSGHRSVTRWSGSGGTCMRRSRATALQDYSEAMTKSKVDDLREAVVGCFAQLCRKGDLVRRIDIDTRDFNVTLFDRHGRSVPKKLLSAGEKQIYAISVLWALAQAS